MSTISDRFGVLAILADALTVSVQDYDIDLVPIAGLVIFISLPFLGLSSSLLTSFAVVFMISALAMAWNIIQGFAGYPDFGLAAYFGAGAYILAIGMEKFALPAQEILGYPIGVYILLVATFVILSVIGLILSPLMQGGRQYYFAFATLIIFVVISESFSLLSELQGYAPGVNGWPVEVALDESGAYLVMLVIFVLLTLFVSVLKQSKYGYGMLTMKEDLSVAKSLGINARRLRVLSMGMYAGFVGVIGFFYAMLIGWVSPEVVFRVEYTLLPIAIVFGGGPGRVRTVFLAGLLILMGREVIKILVPDWSIAVFGIFIVVLSIIVARGDASQLVGKILARGEDAQ